MTPASASPRIDPSTPIQHAIIKANETNQPALRIVFICRPPSRICRPLPIPFPVSSQKNHRPTRPGPPGSANPRNAPFLAGFPSAVAGEIDFELGQGLFPFGAACLPVLQTESRRVLQHPYPPLPVLPQPAHETVERRAQLRHQVAVADKERLGQPPLRGDPPGC